MKILRFSYQEIAFVVHNADPADFRRASYGRWSVSNREIPISDSVLDRWKDWYGELKMTPRRDSKADARRIERLELENSYLRALVVQLNMDKAALQEALDQKKIPRPS